MNELIFDIKKRLVPVWKVLRVKAGMTEEQIEELKKENPAQNYVIVELVGRKDTEPTLTRQEK